MLPEFTQAPADDLISFINTSLLRSPRHGYFVEELLPYVPEAALDTLAARWVATLASEGSTPAIDLLFAHLSLQRPGALQPYLGSLFDLPPNEGCYPENWPWREAPDDAVDSLAVQLHETTDPEVKNKAFNCLLETRSPAALAICAEYAGQNELVYPFYLEEIGYGADQEALYTSASSHLIFPDGYFDPPTYPGSLRGLHPTWHLGQQGQPLRFGGNGAGSCGLCQHPLHHLLDIPEDRVGISNRQQVIALQTCLSCLGWENAELSYQYDEVGGIASLNQGVCIPQFPARPLKECHLHLANTPSRWRWQDWGLSNSNENLHRVGGYPSWIQSAEYPSCPVCQQKMHFMLQLDSGLPTAQDGYDWLWGSGGICYGFSCASCRVVAYAWQCT
ncbi:hypothetical protein SAMN02745857_03028 [Andreprevotia lacus DSM 23236]|uniref:DUF1963 domain-containing protein n=1 Tax=Andreprevotia lacus DSM 23236 TaxID=1121001 RepID=A0A1W1XWN1_9NEIS|nr:DUF1963 domain-containing protein [Andreprevotia lacus]SMC27918.1 hypothetical protein SAMN02745857_03028 [Andreprevotia lacus DSM 23236]